jgi:hypothetical protein
MTLDVRTNGLSLNGVLAAPPRISDQLNAACRSLELTAKTGKLDGLIGKPVELWYNGSRWFYGVLFRRGIDDGGTASYFAYDPLFYFSKNPDDFYFKKGVTATQVLKRLAEYVGVKVYKLLETGVALPALYYQGAPPDKVALDVLARTVQKNSKKYWYRFNPGVSDFGLQLFERVLPATVWAFQVGVNLTAANFSESIEETCTVVKLVNREKHKVVIKENAVAKAAYGRMQYFAEVDGDQAANMEKLALEYLAKLSKVTTEMAIEGVNPNRIIPQLFSGDYIYAEEKHTGIIGAYNILNITQTFISDNLVEIAADIQKQPEVPDVQYQDATKNPNAKKSSASTDVLGF